MTTKRQHAHAHASPDAAATHDDLTPGRASRSAKLDVPAHPITSPLILRKPARDANGVAENADAAIAAATNSSGTPLPEPVMRKFETSLGTDLAGVRVHTGEASAAAAQAVGAKAYTVGQNIHFGAGHYDPSSTGGEHLLAHEIAHTVQQRGGSPARQHKLEVSTPFDAAEHDADRAADAMVTGKSTQLAAESEVHRQVFRDHNPQQVSDDDKQWAANTRAKVDALLATVTTAMKRSNDNAGVANAALGDAKATCEQFEAKFHAAKERFTAQVQKALDDQKAFEDMLGQTFDVVLAASSQAGVSLFVLFRQTQSILKEIDWLQHLAGVAPATSKPSSALDAGSSGVGWKAILDQALATLTSYIKQTESLTATIEACIQAQTWLTQVVGGHGQDQARQSSNGAKADKLAQGAAQAANLGELNIDISVPAHAFADGITTELIQRGLNDPRKIEQDIAIRWMARQPTNPNGTTSTGFGGRGSADIHAARDYLAQLGVIGKRSRTGVDPGLWDTDTDDDMIVARARVESAAMRVVGTTGEWQGGKIDDHVANGHVFTGDETWKASGPAARHDPFMAMQTPGLTEAGGGNVRIITYAIAPISKDVEDAPASMKPALLQGKVTLQIVALGAMGGGAVGPHRSIGPAKGDE